MLERLLSGVSPTARRGITFALIGVAWAGFLIAVLSGLAAGFLFIVFVPVLGVFCYLVARPMEADVVLMD